MRRKLTAITMALAIMTTVMLSPMSTTRVQAQGQGNQALLTVPLNVTQEALNFVGNLNITRFVNQGGQLVAVGNVVGTLTNTATGVVTPILQTFSQVVSIIGTPQASCQVLHLELGPLDLNLLGLMVHLDRVVLDITAQPGPGNLLGNLLCAVANLLNGNGPLGAIAGLLNQILRQL
jgi:hypothetical protein